VAETQRTLDVVLANLPDNTSELIDPVHVRDAVETLRLGHAEMYFTTPAETNIASASTFQKVAGSTALSAVGNHNWTMPAQNRLQYNGTSRRLVHAAVTLSMTAAANNKTVRFTVAKNGVTLTPPISSRFIATGADEGSTALHPYFSVENGDYVELWGANFTDDTNITVTFCNFFLMDMPAGTA
jgi:hypothetical protein